MNDQKPPFRPDWVTDRTFQDAATGTTIVVRRSSHRSPSFELVLEFAVRDRQVRGFRPVATTKLGVVTTARIADVVARLWDEAEDYVAGMKQYQEDMRIEEEVERARPKQGQQKPGLKELSKRDAAARQAREAAAPAPETPKTESNP